MDQQTRSGKSKLLSYILRHHPDKYNLQLDKNGWVNIEILLNAINNSTNNKCRKITYDEIMEIVRLCDKQRFQLDDNRTKIRASQGHSIEVDLEFTPKIPPNILFHGTVEKVKDVILEQGINKMARNHVHLSSNIQTAIEVGKRRGHPIVAIVDAQQMHRDGIEFYVSANNVWLTDYIDPKYVKFFKIDDKCGCGGFIVLNQNKTKCLLVNSNNWGFPKGKKEKHESIMQCAIRELNEETSLTENDITIDYNFPMLFELSHKGEQSVGLFVAYSKKEDGIQIKDTEELNDIGWFSIKDALEKLDGVKNRKQLLQFIFS